MRGRISGIREAISHLSSTAMRHFDDLAAPLVRAVDDLPHVIAIDEYKADTREGKYHLTIADAQTRRPLDSLPDQSAKTVKRYLEQKGHHIFRWSLWI